MMIKNITILIIVVVLIGLGIFVELKKEEPEEIFGSPGWVSPTSHNDPDNQWSNEGNAWDGNLETKADNDDIGYYLELNLTSPISCDKVRINVYHIVIDPWTYIDVYYGGDWHNIYNGYPTKDTWVEAEIGSTETVSKARVKFETSGAGIWEFEFNEAGAPPERRIMEIE